MSDINEKSNFVFEFQPVTKLFEEQVRLHPDKCAVASSKESFTYAQLNERANRIANSQPHPCGRAHFAYCRFFLRAGWRGCRDAAWPDLRVF